MTDMSDSEGLLAHTFDHSEDNARWAHSQRLLT